MQYLFLKSCTPKLPHCCACICFFIEVLAINIFGNKNNHSSSKYSIYFPSSARQNSHIAVSAFATSTNGKNMLKTIASTEQYCGQRLTYEVIAFLPKSGHFRSKLLVMALNARVSTLLYGRQSVAIHFAIVRLIR